MVMPAAVNKRTVEWTLLDDGVPQPGIVLTFIPGVRVINAAGVTTTIKDVTATTDSAGKVSVQLVCTDDPDTFPQVGKWVVVGTLGGQKIGGGFDVPIVGSGVIDLASVVFTTQRPTSGPAGLITRGGAEQIVQDALDGFSGGPGAAQLNDRGDYTTAQADDPAFAVGDRFTWQGVIYIVFEAFTGTSTPDLTKTMVSGPDPASIVDLTQLGAYLPAYIRVSAGITKSVDGDGVITIGLAAPDDPSVTVLASPASGDAPLAVTATATALDAAGVAAVGGTYAWAWGDGATTAAGSSASVGHTYTTAGSYVIGVTYTDTSARTATGETDVTVTTAGAVLYSSRYDADNLTGSTGDPVHVFPDTGTAGRDLTCRFDGSDGVLKVATFSGHNAVATGTRPYSQTQRGATVGDVTVIMACSQWHNDADGKLFPLAFLSTANDNPITTSSGFIGLARSAGVNQYYAYNGATVVDGFLGSATALMTGPHVVTVTLRTGVGTMSTLHVDGVLIGSHSLAGVLGDYLGFGQNPSPNGNGDFWILEARVYESALSDAQRAAEEAAVATAKGITL